MIQTLVSSSEYLSVFYFLFPITSEHETLTAIVYYSVKNIMGYYLSLKSDSGMTKITMNNWNYISKKSYEMAFHGVHRLTSFLHILIL